MGRKWGSGTVGQCFSKEPETTAGSAEQDDVQVGSLGALLYSQNNPAAALGHPAVWKSGEVTPFLRIAIRYLLTLGAGWAGSRSSG